MADNNILDTLVRLGQGVTRTTRTPVEPDPNLPNGIYGVYARKNPGDPKDIGKILLNPGPQYSKLRDVADTLRHEQIHQILRNYKFPDQKGTPPRVERYIRDWLQGNPQREGPAYVFGTAKPFSPFVPYQDVRDYRANFLANAPPDIIQQILKIFGRAAAQE